MQYELNSANVVCDTIDGEVLAIRSDDGSYYSMRGTAATAWVALTAGADLDAASSAISAHHEADPSLVRADLEVFAGLLHTELLVLPVDSQDVDAASESLTTALPPETKGQPWAMPTFDKYTDMQDLLLFDPIHEVQPDGWPAVVTDPPA